MLCFLSVWPPSRGGPTPKPRSRRRSTGPAPHPWRPAQPASRAERDVWIARSHREGRNWPPRQRCEVLRQTFAGRGARQVTHLPARVNAGSQPALGHVERGEAAPPPRQRASAAAAREAIRALSSEGAPVTRADGRAVPSHFGKKSFAEARRSLQRFVAMHDSVTTNLAFSTLPTGRRGVAAERSGGARLRTPRRLRDS